MTVEPESEGPGQAIVAAANATGVPTTIKGKVQRAILRLIIGTINPDHIEKMRANVSTVEGRYRIDAMVAEEIGRQAIADPVFMERAKARFLGELGQKQENVEGVATKAQTKIEAAEDGDARADNPEAEPSQDWMNTFTRAAEDASSDELRERLATVLAGEARRPGTYSRSTVRLISELEKEVLEGFQHVLTYRAGDAIYREESWNKGDLFAVGVMLENSGLISGTAGFMQRVMKIGDNRNGFFIGKKSSLVVVGEADVEIQVPIWLLTKAGVEVASLLPENDERAALRAVATRLDKSKLERITLGTNLPAPPGELRVTQEEILWPEQTTPVRNFNFNLGDGGNGSSMFRR